MPPAGERRGRAALSLSSSLFFFSCRQSLSAAELTFFLSANSTKMCFQPSSYPVPGWLRLTSAREADHLLGFSVCSWEGGLAEQITKQAPAPTPAWAGLAPRVVGEALPAAGSRWAWSSRRPHVWANRSPHVSVGQKGEQGRMWARRSGFSWLQGRIQVGVLSLGFMQVVLPFAELVF